MPESGPTANKIEELRRRFEEQPASRIFLQLAEEYRRLGLPEQAIEVLEAGLAKRPGDLSGMVALGRCRLEIGLLEGAVETLEGVIARDAAHLVANKLLIEAHLQLGDPERAGQRLELYKLLNDRDPEIDDLETRLRALRRSARDTSDTAPLPAEPVIEELVVEPTAAGDPFAVELAEIEAVAPAAVFPAEPQPALSPAPPPPVPAPVAVLHEPAPAEAPIVETRGVVFTLSPLPELSLDGLWRASGARPRTLHRRVEPFGSLPAPGGQELRPLLAAGVVFPPAVLNAAPASEPPRLEAAPIAVPRPLEPEISELEIVEAEAPAPEFALREFAEPEVAALEVVTAEVAEPELAEAEISRPEIAQPVFETPIAARFTEPVEATVEVSAADVLASRPEPVIYEESFEEEPSTVAIDLPEPAAFASAARPGFEIPTATVTLAELYLAQGHVEEARRIIDEVLARDPANTHALEVLARLEPPLQRLTAANLLALLPAGEVPQGLTAKKILVLSAYLQRLRRRHVR